MSRRGGASGQYPQRHDPPLSHPAELSSPYSQGNFSDPGPGGAGSVLHHLSPSPHTTAIHLIERPGSRPAPPPAPDLNGWDYEFVPKPDSKYECPICLLVLRDPFQTMCGHRFCSDCIHKWLRTPPDVHCPVCNELISDAALFPDKFANREILGFKIRCPSQTPKPGCQMILALKELEEHLASTCQYELVQCPNHCRTPLLRKDVQDHCDRDCSRRMVQCPYCRQRVPVTDETVHYKECPDMKTNCEHCNQSFLRKNIDIHRREECDEAPVTCSFYSVGCHTQLSRKSLQQHNSDNIQPHMDMMMYTMNSLMATAPSEPPSLPTRRASSQLRDGGYPHRASGKFSGYQQKSGANSTSWEELCATPHRYGADTSFGPSCAEAMGESESLKPSLYDDLDEKRRHQDGQLVKHDQQLLALNAKVENLDKKCREQHSTIQERDDMIQCLEARLSNGVYYWRVKEFSVQRQEAKAGLVTVLHSPGFYTSSYGYKLCIRANLNGVDGGNGSHVSLFIHFMRGEFDDILDWPFKGRITLSILDQGEPKQHIVEVLESKPTLAAFQRPHSNRNHKGFGYIEFAPIGLIENSSYVKGDTLIIKAEVTEL